MISVSYYFKIRIVYKYKIFATDNFKIDSSEYEIIVTRNKNISFSDITNEVFNTAKELNKEECGDLPHYEYAGWTIIEKRIIYIKK